MNPATVPLPKPTRGNFPSSLGNRRWIIPETRCSTKSNHEILLFKPTQQDLKSLASIKDHLRLTKRGIESLKIRVAFLRFHLDRAKAKSRVFLPSNAEWKEPPDPGRSQSTEPGTNSSIKGHEDHDVSWVPFLPEEKEMLSFTGSKSEHKAGINKVMEDLLFRGSLLLQNSSQAPRIQYWILPVHTRCLCFCLRATMEAMKSLQEATGPVAARAMAAVPSAGSSGILPTSTQRPGKEIAKACAGPVKKTLVINMSGARNAVQARFLAVGLFLSVLLVNSKQLIDHMKKVWKVRGELGDHELAAEEGRKFVLEFSEDGDRQHVIKGGPWQYKGDAFLVVGLEKETDPASITFSHMPMWVQFRGIPFYLLTKELARNLGDHVGRVVMIDPHSRGNICDKFLRVRVQLPLFLALQKEITLADEITEEEVTVYLRYERLPNFCLFCGYIGHMEARCDIPNEEKKLRYSKELGVFPVHFDDPRAWFLLEKMGQKQGSQSSPPLWRAPKPVCHDKDELTTVEQIREVVARLSVGDGMETDTNQKEIQNTVNLTAEKVEATNALTLNETLISASTNLKTVDNISALSSVEHVPPKGLGTPVKANDQPEVPDDSSFPPGLDPTPRFVGVATSSAGDAPPVQNAQDSETLDSTGGEDAVVQKNSTEGEALITGGVQPLQNKEEAVEGSGKTLGESTETNSGKNEGKNGRKTSLKISGKRKVASVSVLGKREVRGQSDSDGASNEEGGTESDQNKKKKAVENPEGKSNTGKDGGQEATGPGAPGLLVGAMASTHQEP